MDLEQAKEIPMLLITVFVMIFITIMFYILIGNFQIGSNVDISDSEAEIVSLRALKCLENNEKLEDCIKSNKYYISVKEGDITSSINDNLKDKDLYLREFIFGNSRRITVGFVK